MNRGACSRRTEGCPFRSTRFIKTRHTAFSPIGSGRSPTVAFLVPDKTFREFMYLHFGGGTERKRIPTHLHRTGKALRFSTLSDGIHSGVLRHGGLFQDAKLFAFSVVIFKLNLYYYICRCRTDCFERFFGSPSGSQLLDRAYTRRMNLH